MTAPPTRQELTITVKATIDGFPVDVCFSGSIDQLLGVTKRLREMGAAPTVAAPPTRKAAERVQPTYNGAGEPCCPKHNRTLKEGQYGLYCSAKDDTTERGYCALEFKD
jgi:hypothetical protein